MFYCYFLLLLLLFYLFFFFHDKRLPIDNVYFNKYDEPFEAPPLLILPLFRSGKVGQLFSQA